MEAAGSSTEQRLPSDHSVGCRRASYTPREGQRRSALRAVVRDVAFAYRDEQTPAGGRDLTAGRQLRLHRDAVVGGGDDATAEVDGTIGGRGALQPDRVFRGHRDRRLIRAASLHQVVSRSPVAVAVEQRPDDPAVQDSRERLMVRPR